MTIPDTASVMTAFFAVLKTDTGAAPVALRAALGGGAASVISADDLSAASLPVAPFVALRGGPVSGAHEWETQRLTATWWLYDDVVRKFSRIDALIALIAACYPADTETITACDIRRGAVGIVPRDAALGNRPARSVTYRISWR